MHEMGHEITGINLNAEWRTTYPDRRWLELFSVRECDIEHEDLPIDARSLMQSCLRKCLSTLRSQIQSRSLQAGSRIEGWRYALVSTPNVCNLSNVIALCLGHNIFWPKNIFYGSLDRHNREWTPSEARSAFVDAGFGERAFFGINDHSNWRTGASDLAYRIVGELGETHSMLRNTIVGVFSKT